MASLSECPICLEDYTDPKIMPCQHSLCATCVDGWKKGDRIVCPICKADHDVTSLRADFRYAQYKDELRVKVKETQIKEAKADSGPCFKPRFISLKDDTFEQTKVIRLERDHANGIIFIQNEFWVMEHQGVIEIFDDDLNYQRTIRSRKWGDVYDVTPLPNSDIILSSDRGLFHLSPSGDSISRINDSWHNSAVYVDNQVIGFARSPPRLCFFEKRDGKWQKVNTVPLPLDHWTYYLIVNNRQIYACSRYFNDVVVMSLSGALLYKLKLKEPCDNAGDRKMSCFLTGVDEEGSALLADRDNYRLLVADKSGQCSAIRLEPAIMRPRAAIVRDNKLYVITNEYNSYIKLYNR